MTIKSTEERKWATQVQFCKADLLEHVEHDVGILRFWEDDPEETIDLVCVTCEGLVLASIERKKRD